MEAVGVPDLGSRFEPKWIGTVCLYGGDVPNGLMVAMVVISAADGDGGDGCDHCLTCRFRHCFAQQLQSKSHWQNRLLEAQNICGKLGNAKSSHLVRKHLQCFLHHDTLAPWGGLHCDHKRGAPHVGAMKGSFTRITCKLILFFNIVARKAKPCLKNNVYVSHAFYTYIRCADALIYSTLLSRMVQR